MLGSCRPCDRSPTVSGSGQRVARTRRRRSTSCSFGMLTWNGRIEPSVAVRAEVANRAEAPTAAELPRKLRRLSDDDVADTIVLPVGNATCNNQLMLAARDGGGIG